MAYDKTQHMTTPFTYGLYVANDLCHVHSHTRFTYQAGRHGIGWPIVLRPNGSRANTSLKYSDRVISGKPYYFYFECWAIGEHIYKYETTTSGHYMLTWVMYGLKHRSDGPGSVSRGIKTISEGGPGYGQIYVSLERELIYYKYDYATCIINEQLHHTDWVRELPNYIAKGNRVAWHQFVGNWIYFNGNGRIIYYRVDGPSEIWAGCDYIENDYSMDDDTE